MPVFQMENFNTQLAALTIDSLIENLFLNDQKFYCSQLEFSDDEDEKYFVPIFQCETQLSDQKINFVFCDGSKNLQSFQLLLCGAEPENCFLIFLDLEEIDGNIFLYRKTQNKELSLVSSGIEERLEIALLITKIDRQGKVLLPTDYKRKEFLSLVQNYLINYLNR